MKYAFISRHKPTPEQIEQAKAVGVEIVHVGDADAFNFSLANLAGYEGIVCVHPVIAMKAMCSGYEIGIFENANRAPEGAKPEFYSKSFHRYCVGHEGQFVELR